MIVHTCFNNTSEHGYSSKILKSGICKYMRRHENDKLVWCIMEMALFHDHPKGSGLITNLINRLKILLMEEISPSEGFVIQRGSQLLDTYEKYRDQRHLLLDFCNLIKNVKRTRITSYINNWWRYQDSQLVIHSIDKCEKFRKEGDSDELLLLGENLIHFIEQKDERMFSLFRPMYDMKSGAGTRYRRKDPIYLWWEIILSYLYSNKGLAIIFEFAISMFHRKGMIERPAFGIWIGIMIWKQDLIDFTPISYITHTSEDLISYYKSMNKIQIDSYVIDDYHVNKSLGLEHFAINGGFVKDEDLSFLDNPQQYKDFYIQKKAERDKQPLKKIKKKKQEKITYEGVTYYKQNTKIFNEDMIEVGKWKQDTIQWLSETYQSYHEINQTSVIEFISWDHFSQIQVIQEGVCGGKVPCIIVTYKDKKYILKEMGASMNYGKDYIIMDLSKSVFGLRSMNMKLIQSEKGFGKLDKTNRSFVNNWTFIDKITHFCMMDYFENIGDLGKNKNKLQDENVKYQCLLIRLFDGLFMSSDNILRNILVNESGDLLSIDEGDMFGKRKLIFNKHDWCKKNCDHDLFHKVVDDLLSNGDHKKKIVNNLMKQYGLNYCNSFNKRFDTYKDIVFQELSGTHKNLKNFIVQVSNKMDRTQELITTIQTIQLTNHGENTQLTANQHETICYDILQIHFHATSLEKTRWRFLLTRNGFNTRSFTDDPLPEITIRDNQNLESNQSYIIKQPFGSQRYPDIILCKLVSCDNETKCILTYVECKQPIPTWNNTPAKRCKHCLYICGNKPFNGFIITSQEEQILIQQYIQRYIDLCQEFNQYESNISIIPYKKIELREWPTPYFIERQNQNIPLIHETLSRFY